MTSKQIDSARKTLPSIREYQKWSKKDKQLDKELACRSMMVSFFAYGGTRGITNEDGWEFQRYLQQYLDELGRKRFDEIRKEQLDTFSRATVHYGVYTDSEGCTYNSIDWGE